MSLTSQVPTALIVHAHPEPTSFSAAQLQAAAASLTGAGYHVDVIDLHAQRWAPVLDQHEFTSFDRPFKPQQEQMRAAAAGTLDPEVQSHLDRLLTADLLVLSFPLWWFSMPAILKGWIDRVFVMGVLFGGELGLFDRAAMHGKRAMVLLTTGGSAESFTAKGAFGPMADFLFHIHRGMLEFVGYEIVSPVITYGPAHLTPDQRTSALDAVASSFASIDAPVEQRRG